MLSHANHKTAVIALYSNMLHVMHTPGMCIIGRIGFLRPGLLNGRQPKRTS